MIYKRKWRKEEKRVERICVTRKIYMQIFAVPLRTVEWGGRTNDKHIRTGTMEMTVRKKLLLFIKEREKERKWALQYYIIRKRKVGSLFDSFLGEKRGKNIIYRERRKEKEQLFFMLISYDLKWQLAYLKYMLLIYHHSCWNVLQRYHHLPWMSFLMYHPIHLSDCVSSVSLLPLTQLLRSSLPWHPTH